MYTIYTTQIAKQICVNETIASDGANSAPGTLMISQSAPGAGLPPLSSCAPEPMSK